MTKQAFLERLENSLSCLSRQDVAERLTFYSEMIDDRMEEGLSEEAAVAAVGTVEEITAQILGDMPPKKQKRTWKTWEILLMALGSPVWVSLLVSAVAVVLSVYVSLWSVIVSLWAVFGSLAGCVLGGAVSGAVHICLGNVWQGLAMLGGGIFCAGLAIFVFFGCKAVTKWTVAFTKKSILWIKGRICNG